MMRIILTALFAFALPLFSQGTAISTNTWVPISAHGGPAEILGFDKTTVTPVGHCVWGGWKQAYSSEPNQAAVCWNYAENRWIPLVVNEMWHTEHYGGAGHSNGVYTYLSDYGSIVHYVDGSGSNVGEMHLGHLWWYDVLGLTGRDRTLGGTTAKPWQSTLTPAGAAAYDPVNHKMLFYPTFDLAGNVAGRLYDPATNTFSVATTTGQPPIGLNFFAAIYYGGKIWFYGGATGSGPGADIYTYNVTTNTWATIAPASCTGAHCVSGKPPARIAAGFDCSDVDNLCLMASGMTSFSSGTAFTDTWIYDPVANTWTEQTPAAGYFNNSPNTVFGRMAFDHTNNVFVMLAAGGSTPYADGTWGFGIVKPYVYALSTALNYGRTVNTYTPSTDSRNHVTPTSSSNTSLGTQSWSYGTAITAASGNLIAGWIESFTYFDTTNCGAVFHPYVSTSPNSATWTDLPSGNMTDACNAIDPEPGGDPSHTTASNLRLASIGGVTWEAHEKWNNGGITSAAYVRQWNGTNWNGGQVGCFTGACGDALRQYPAAIIGVGTTPTVAVIENNHAVSANSPMFLYVAQWNGTAWARLGSGKLNINATNGSRALGAALATNGTVPYACWNEEVDDTSTRQSVLSSALMYCAQWSGSTWTTLNAGAAMNQISGSWAGKPSMTYLGSVLYIAWTERLGSGVAKLYVASWAGGALTILGGSPLNIDATTGWAFSPKLANDGSSIFVVWEEQQALGQHNLGHGKKWDGATWTTLGTAFAADTTNGSIDDLDLTVVSGYPTAIFTELVLGNLRQTYIRQWNGALWNSTLGTTPCFIISTVLNIAVINIAYSYQVPTSGCIAPAFAVTTGTLPTGLSMSAGGLITGTPTVLGSSTITITATDSNGVPVQPYTLSVESATSAVTAGGVQAGGIKQ